MKLQILGSGCQVFARGMRVVGGYNLWRHVPSLFHATP